jgi:hypothetical protein
MRERQAKMVIRKSFIILLALVTVLICGISCTTSQTAQPADKTWLSPGKIQFSNVVPGKSITQKITIHNGRESNAAFLVYYRIPDYVENNYVVAPAEASDWIKIGEASPVFAPRETKEVQVVLEVPDGAQTPERWELWVGVKENTANMVTTELCSRWLITMRNR